MKKWVRKCFFVCAIERLFLIAGVGSAKGIFKEKQFIEEGGFSSNFGKMGVGEVKKYDIVEF